MLTARLCTFSQTLYNDNKNTTFEKGCKTVGQINKCIIKAANVCADSRFVRVYNYKR